MTGLGLAALVAGWLMLLPGLPAARDAGALPRHRPGVAQRSADAPSPPVGLEVPGRLTARVVPVAHAPDGSLEVPEPPGDVGWWPLGAQPGAAEGTVLLAGHVDSQAHGPGAFAALHRVPLGARVEVTGADGRRHPYVVTARRVYRKADLPRGLFTATGPARLALVTCTGEYDAENRRYAENLVLFGEPAPAGRMSGA
ncbi:class F sortase [Streptomyces sp. URMC 123]|uniref:class F sortase n=1 Tax=Streptomyces sp. URMC 123 TaxID=3423403 RepID=UPI003F1C4F39